MIFTINGKQTDISLPSEKEIRAAVKICCGRCCKACETPVEYAWKKRQTDLAKLLDMAIETELTDKEREYIKEVYFNEKSYSKVAEEKGVSASAVSAAAARAKAKLKRALEYVVVYQNELEGAQDVEPFLNIAAAINAEGKNRMQKGKTNERSITQ